jgi:hypothetical protein
MKQDRPTSATLWLASALSIVWACAPLSFAAAGPAPDSKSSLAQSDIGKAFRDRFLECDIKDTCEGNLLKHGCSKNPNKNSMVLKLKDGTVVFDGKMALDADGSPYAMSKRSVINQPFTSLKYPTADHGSINADRVPFIVIPLGRFDQTLGVTIGDVGAIVHGGKRIYAIVADYGPACKIGEASIRAHELLDHNVCKKRAENGDCTQLHDEGIPQDVMYFIFPNTRDLLYKDLAPENINARIEAVGSNAWQAFASN